MDRYRFLVASQDRLCLVAVLGLSLFFSVSLSGFANTENFLSLLQSVAFLGILGVGQSIVVLSGHIDLTQTIVMVVSSCFTVGLLSSGTPPVEAVAGGVGVAMLFGLTTGLITSSINVSPFVVTLALSFIYFGLAQTVLIGEESVFQIDEAANWVFLLAKGKLFEVPFPVLIFVGHLILLGLFLNRTSLGRAIRAVGSNAFAARINGFPVKLVVTLTYVGCAVVSYVAGMMLFASVRIIVYETFAASTTLYDIILIVILGGVSISGGKGGALSVFSAALLVAVITNGFLLMNLSNDFQQVLKGFMLISIVFLDARFNPRSEANILRGDLL